MGCEWANHGATVDVVTHCKKSGTTKAPKAATGLSSASEKYKVGGNARSGVGVNPGGGGGGGVVDCSPGGGGGREAQGDSFSVFALSFSALNPGGGGGGPALSFRVSG